MPVGLSATKANAIVDDLTLKWVQLHTADPGAAGTTAVATTVARKQVTLGSASAGAATSTGALTWTSGEVLATQTITHYSMWSASTAGTFEFSGTVSGSTVNGVEFVISIGDFDVSVSTVAS